jgi:hypothetical protein
MAFSSFDTFCQHLKIAKQLKLKTTTRKKNITTLDQMIEEHYGKIGLGGRLEINIKL